MTCVDPGSQREELLAVVTVGVPSGEDPCEISISSDGGYAEIRLWQVRGRSVTGSVAATTESTVRDL